MLKYFDHYFMFKLYLNLQGKIFGLSKNNLKSSLNLKVHSKTLGYE
jgi:hypothetical protein